MAENKRLEKSSSDVYKWYTSYRCDLLVNYVSLGIMDTRLVGMTYHANTIQEILWPTRTSRRHYGDAR